MTAKSTEKKEAKQVVDPKEASKLKEPVVATENDVTIPTPVKEEDKKKQPTITKEGGVTIADSTKLKTPQDYQHEKDFAKIEHKEIIVDKERLEVVPHELTGEPVFSTAAEYQTYLKNK